MRLRFAEGIVPGAASAIAIYRHLMDCFRLAASALCCNSNINML